MNAKKNEELGKRLSAIQSPQPPEGLLETIKAEIPERLEVQNEPARRSWIHSWPLRVAATVVVVLGAGILGREAMKQESLRRTDAPASVTRPVEVQAPAVGHVEATMPQVAFGEPAEERAADSATVPSSTPVDVPQPEASQAAVKPQGMDDAVPAVAFPQRANESAESKLAVAPPANATVKGASKDEATILITAPASPIYEALQVPKKESRTPSAAPSQPLGGVVGGTIGGSVTHGEAPARSRMAGRDEVDTSLTVERQQSNRRLMPPPSPPPSTGGTAEPNAQAYGDVFHKDYGVNPFIDTDDDRFSTFAMDVDTASYTIVRRYLMDGNLPPSEAVRTEELLNYFDYQDPAPRRGDFALYAEGAPAPSKRGERYGVVRFGIRAREIARTDRQPVVLTFVIDISGSMRRESRLELVKRALDLFIGELDRHDRLGLVVFGTEARVLLEPTTDHGAIRDAIQRLHPEGSTNAEEGLRLGYELAARYARRDTVNRVILCSDGVANVGHTSAESILAQIGWKTDEVELTTVGFGMGNYNDVLMEQLANRGNGRYAYVDDLDEARRIFVETLTGTLETVARDAKVQVEFNPKAVARYRLIGYENRDVADHRFRDDTVDAGEIGAGHHVTAVYEVKFQPGYQRNDHVAALRIRYKSVSDGGRAVEIGRWLKANDFAASWEGASRDLRLASIVASFGDVLKRSPWSREIEMRELARHAAQLANRSSDPKLRDFADLTTRAARLMEHVRPQPPDPDEE